MQFTPSSGDCDFSYYRKSKSSRKHRRHFLDYNNNNNSICRKILPFFPFFFVIIPENCLGCNWDSTVFPLSFNIEKPSVSINWLLLASFGLIVFAFLILDVTAAGSASSMNYLDVVLRTFSTIQCIFVEKKKNFCFFLWFPIRADGLWRQSIATKTTQSIQNWNVSIWNLELFTTLKMSNSIRRESDEAKDVMYIERKLSCAYSNKRTK